MALNLNFKIFSMNVPSWLKHKTRSEEIEELPSYLQVSATGTGSLSLVNVGPVQPSPDHSVYPWFKMDSSGLFVGLFVCINGSWVQVAGSLPYITSATAPTDTTAIWLKIDGSGVPKGFYKYVTGTTTWTPVPVGT